MPSLLSGSKLRKGGSNTYINLSQAQPQLPPTPTTSTGYTIVTTDKLVTSYRSSLGNIEMHLGEMYSNLPGQNVKIIGTDSNLVIVSGGTVNTSTSSGALLVDGGIGIRDGLYTGKDIYVNGLRIGRGFEGNNNIVIKGEASPLITNEDDGQEAIVIGYDALNGITTSYKTIALGRYALNSGTSLSRSIAIGDSALKNIGVYHTLPVADITGITLTNPVVVTAPDHDITSGTHISIFNVGGTVQLNNNSYYAWVLSSSTIALYTDVNLNNSLDGTGFTAYVSSGTVEVNTVYDDNIAVGVDAGTSLINGRQNFFMGAEIAKNLTTGSYNILIGHEVAANMITGNANISIGGDNLVNGRDNQINIGSTFYYDGQGYTQINGNLGTGIGTVALPKLFLDTIITATNTNPVVIKTAVQGISSGTRIVIDNISGMTELNQQIFFAGYAGTGTGSTHYARLYYDVDLTQTVDGTVFNPCTSTGTVYKLDPQGAVSVFGGVGINGNLIVTDQTDIYAGMTVRNLITGTITTATNLAGGALGSIPYQEESGVTKFIEIGDANTVLTSNGTTATWSLVGGLSAGTAVTATNAENLLVLPAVPEVVYYPVVAEGIGDFTPVDAESSFTYVTTTATTSTYWSSGTSVLNVPGSVYSNDGSPDEHNLLYSARVTVSTTAPLKPRVGDFWIDPTYGVELQYINDGGNKFWIQFTGL